jgi:hypothetical protein
VLGNSGKALHPRNVGFAEIREISSRIIIGMTILVSWKRNVHEGTMMGFRVFLGFQVMCKNDSRIWLLRVNLLSISGWLKPAKLWNHELVKFWNHEPVKLRNRGSAKFGNLLNSKFGGYDVWRYSRIRDSETSKKPSQRRCLKSPGLTCELVAGL